MQEKGSIYDPYYGAPEEERERMRQTAELQAATDRSNQSMAVTESNAQALAAAAQARVSELESNRDALTRQYGARQYEQALTKAKQAVTAATTRGSELMAQQAQTGQSMVAEATPAPRPIKGTMPEAGYTRGGFEGDPRLNTPLSKPFVAAPKVDAAPTADTGRQPRPNTGQETPRAPAVPEQTAAQRYAEMQKGLAPDRTKIDKGIAALSESMRKTAKGELEDFDKEVAERGVAFKGREERLAKREEGLSKRKDENMGLSLLEAGLAIMSTPGSLATAIGKGAQTGLKTYSAGLKDLRAAQEKMDDARDQIEEFRRNEANMTAKERRQYKSAIGRTENEIEKLGLQAAEKMYGYKRSDAETIFKADTQERLTDKEIDAKRDIAAMQERSQSARSAAQIAATLNTPDRLVFNQLLKANGNDAVKAAEAMQKLKAEKFNMYEAYSKYLSGFAGKENLMKGPDDFDVFAKRFIPTVTPGKNTTVRTQPGG
jgi:hypothetical protein